MLQANFQNQLTEAGCDEAGRGCLAGPVVAAAVIFPVGFQIPGLNDSKQLSAAQRSALVPVIKEHAISWATAFCTPAEVDDLNILRASFVAMHRAVRKLRPEPELLLIDGNRFYAYPGIPHRCFVKGDCRFTAIAAASILAKTERDRMMDILHDQHPVYGWNENKGYPTSSHRKAIESHGINHHHRQTFRLAPDNQVLLFNETDSL